MLLRLPCGVWADRLVASDGGVAFEEEEASRASDGGAISNLKLWELPHSEDDD